MENDVWAPYRKRPQRTEPPAPVDSAYEAELDRVLGEQFKQAIPVEGEKAPSWRRAIPARSAP